MGPLPTAQVWMAIFWASGESGLDPDLHDEDRGTSLLMMRRFWAGTVMPLPKTEPWRVGCQDCCTKSRPQGRMP